jgi:hypothetical protein
MNKIEVIKTIDKNPKEYRICQRLLKSGYIMQTVLQGLYYWTDDKGNNGADWIDIPTVAEIME